MTTGHEGDLHVYGDGVNVSLDIRIDACSEKITVPSSFILRFNNLLDSDLEGLELVLKDALERIGGFRRDLRTLYHARGLKGGLG